MRYLSFLVFSTTMVSSAYAMNPIPPQSGFSGFINLGAGVTSVESNTLAKFSSVDLGNKNITLSLNHLIVKLPLYQY